MYLVENTRREKRIAVRARTATAAFLEAVVYDADYMEFGVTVWQEVLDAAATAEIQSKLLAHGWPTDRASKEA